jgi:hypothetical protein
MKRPLAWIALAVSSVVMARAAAQDMPRLSNEVLEATLKQGFIADAAALRELVKAGDPRLVQNFGAGMQRAQVELSPEIEAIVIANFDDKRVGAALRAMPPRYHTRELFDLHYARVSKAYDVGEPSIGQILNTMQPGIDEELLKLVPKLPKRESGIDRFTYFVALRHHPAALPLLFDALPASYPNPKDMGYPEVFGRLIDYPSEDVWKRTAAKLAEMHTYGRIGDEQYRFARQKLEALLKDPKAKLEEMRLRDAWNEYRRRIGEADFARGRRELLKGSAPAAYVGEEERALAMSDAIAKDIGTPNVVRESGHTHYNLAMFARFRALDPAAAAQHYSVAIDRGVAIARVALADVYEFELADKKAAIVAFEKVLKEAGNPSNPDSSYLFDKPGSRTNTWWQAWFTREIDYLRNGRPFRGAITEAEIGGFFEVMLDKSPAVTSVFAPEILVSNAHGARDARTGRPFGGTWNSARGELMNMKRETLPARLGAIPSSHIALMALMRHASGLTDPDAILEFFARNDPGGYWSACVFGTIVYLDGLGARRNEEAVRNESAALLPGMTADEEPRPLSVAAARYLRSRNLRAKPGA